MKAQKPSQSLHHSRPERSNAITYVENVQCHIARQEIRFAPKKRLHVGLYFVGWVWWILRNGVTTQCRKDRTLSLALYYT